MKREINAALCEQDYQQKKQSGENQPGRTETIKIILTINVRDTIENVIKMIEDFFEFDLRSLTPFDLVRRHNGRITQSLNGWVASNFEVEFIEEDFKILDLVAQEKFGVKLTLTINVSGVFIEARERMSDIGEFNLLEPFDIVRRHNVRVTESLNDIAVSRVAVEFGVSDGTLETMTKVTMDKEEI